MSGKIDVNAYRLRYPKVFEAYDGKMDDESIADAIRMIKEMPEEELIINMMGAILAIGLLEAAMSEAMADDEPCGGSAPAQA